MIWLCIYCGMTTAVSLVIIDHLHYSSNPSLSCIWFFATPWTAGFPVHCQLTELLKLMSIKSVMPTNHLIFCHPLLLLPSIFPSMRVFSVLCIRWPKYWSFSFSIFPKHNQDWFPLGLTGLISLLSKRLLRVFSSTTVQMHQYFDAQLSLWSNCHIHIWLLEKA